MKKAWVGDVETTAAMYAWLATATDVHMVDLYDITLATLGYPDKLVLRYCDATFDVPFFTPDTTSSVPATYAGAFHLEDAVPAPPWKIKRGELRETIGVEIDTLKVEVYLDGTDFLPPADGDPATPRFGLNVAIRTGMLDGANVVVRRLYFPAPPVHPIEADGIANRGDLLAGDTSLGAITLFAGFIGDAEVSRSIASLKVVSELERTSVSVPMDVFQGNCRWSLYGRMCGVSRTGSFAGNDFQALARVCSDDSPTPGETVLVTSSFPTNTALTQPQNFFRFGTLQFTSGLLAGLSRTIQTSGDFFLPGTTYAQLLRTLPLLPAPGDSVIMQAGCRKDEDDCTDKFDNFDRFGGFPRVPPPDSAV